MAKETTVFLNGASQAVRIPKDMRFTSDRVLIDRIGPVMVIIDSNDPWASLRLAQILMAGKFMEEGRHLNPIIDREAISARDSEE